MEYGQQRVYKIICAWAGIYFELRRNFFHLKILGGRIVSVGGANIPMLAVTLPGGFNILTSCLVLHQVLFPGAVTVTERYAASGVSITERSEEQGTQPNIYS